MTFERLMWILWLQASVLGVCALVAFRVGFRSGYWRGVARGMHVVQLAAMQIAAGDIPDLDLDSFEPKRKEPN